MNFRTAVPVILLLCLLTGCLAGTPQPISVTSDAEIILSVGQTVSLSDANLSITLLNVVSDERCPSEIERAASGPVTLRLSIRNKDGVTIEETLQSFTDSNGLAPDRDFEGIRSAVSIDEFEIRILGVSPYPKDRSDSIKPSEYKVNLKVSMNE
jgi:hypothetical protein